MGDLSCAPVSFGLQRALGFTDKNKNGTIDKTSEPKQNEGYVAEADINNDEKICHIEAKYFYLQNLAANEKENQEEDFALTSQESAELVGTC